MVLDGRLCFTPQLNIGTGEFLRSLSQLSVHPKRLCVRPILKSNPMLRPRFTLRVMLAVMAMVAVVMWRHVDWINQRRAAIMSGRVSRGRSIAAPGLLRLFGESGYNAMLVDPAMDDSGACSQRLHIPTGEWVSSDALHPSHPCGRRRQRSLARLCNLSAIRG